MLESELQKLLACSSHLQAMAEPGTPEKSVLFRSNSAAKTLINGLAKLGDTASLVNSDQMDATVF